MTPKEWAEKLNGMEYGEEPDKTELAKDGIVCIFGASDDLCEIIGAVDEELDAYQGTTIYFTQEGLLMSKCEDERCPYFAEELKSATKIKMSGLPWRFQTDIQHEVFEMVENGSHYGHGIVFRLADVPEKNK